MTVPAEIDVGRARRETPGVANVAHFNNAGAALLPEPVINAQNGHLAREAAIGGYEAAEEASDALAGVYASVASLIGAHPHEIALMESATRAWGAAFGSIGWQAGDRILTAEAEYASNFIAFLQLQKRAAIEVDIAPSDAAGQVDVAAMERLITARTRLIAVTHVPTSGGLVNPAAEVGALARRHGVLYLLDACQSVGQLDLDVADIGCDLLSATGRKYLRAPRGTGFLYVRRDLLDRLDPPFLDLHGADWLAPDRYQMRDDATRFENFEGHVAGKLGLGAAAGYAIAWGMPAVERRIVALGDMLRAALSDVPGVTVTDTGARKCGIVTFTHDRAPPPEIRKRLRTEGINVSVSVRTSTLLDMERRGLDAVTRASVHYYNTEAEIARLAAAVAAV